jgi:hypothetical protein
MTLQKTKKKKTRYEVGFVKFNLFLRSDMRREMYELTLSIAF